LAAAAEEEDDFLKNQMVISARARTKEAAIPTPGMSAIEPIMLPCWMVEI
jgi:hypothetical protein